MKDICDLYYGNHKQIHSPYLTLQNTVFSSSYSNERLLHKKEKENCRIIKTIRVFES